MLHDIGRLAMFYADAPGLDQVVARHLSGEGPLEKLELEALGYDHAAVGGGLAERWGLPEDITELEQGGVQLIWS